MSRRRFTEEQIIGAVQQMASGRGAADITREVGREQAHNLHVNQKYGRMNSDDASGYDTWNKRTAG